MKHLLSLLVTSAVFAICGLLQTGCAGGYAVAAPGYGTYAPYGGAYYGGVGFYRGAYYGNSAYWNGGSGYAYGARGGSATWNNGSGSATPRFRNLGE